MTKAIVTERALFARIDRKLSKDGERLRRCKEDSKSFSDLGSLYIVDRNLNTIIAKHCDLERLGREIGALAEWEILEKD